MLLEPMQWKSDWPRMGIRSSKSGTGEPVRKFRKPYKSRHGAFEVPQTNDEFKTSGLGLQWQWESNPITKWYSLDAHQGWLRMYSQTVSEGWKNLWHAGSILGCKIPAPEFSVTAKLDFRSMSNGECSGLIVLGTDYSYVGVKRTQDSYKAVQVVCREADKDSGEVETDSVSVSEEEIYLRIAMVNESVCTFWYSQDGKAFHRLGHEFRARPGKWVGARIGMFAEGKGDQKPAGSADFDWIRFGSVHEAGS